MLTDYPHSIAEVLDPPVRFRTATIEAVQRFSRSRPWRGSSEDRKAKFLAVHADLCRIYGTQTTLTFGVMDGGCSGGSHYNPSSDEIVVIGRLSVVSFLHEFAHALGRDE